SGEAGSGEAGLHGGFAIGLDAGVGIPIACIQPAGESTMKSGFAAASLSGASPNLHPIETAPMARAVSTSISVSPTISVSDGGIAEPEAAEASAIRASRPC